MSADAADALERRRRYERDVRRLAAVARAEHEAGLPIAELARDLVQRRNALKAQYRRADDPVLVRIMEERNQRKYGDPIGPDADQLLLRYGDWHAVIDAACRPARVAD